MTPRWPDDPVALRVAGMVIADADRLVARYCGVTGEVWAYRFYDRVPTDQEGVTDLLAAAVLHRPLRRADLQWYVESQAAIADLVTSIPEGRTLDGADDGLLDLLAEGVARIAEDDPARSGLLTKVLHRHRPGLVVIEERDIARRYAAHLGATGRLRYRALLDAVATDLATGRRPLQRIAERLHDAGIDPPPTPLRILDIALWMDAAR